MPEPLLQLGGIQTPIEQPQVVSMPASQAQRLADRIAYRVTH